ncbi:MAG: hypothetical protein KKE02_03090 [Alphaproteobacteria bacterium]|nr:hypothetical protein [Alphaproteobacteria bacterium]MBU1512814.1 hypothetical protein [Alphaproteobacteria bacterium]MBU2093990.1 hypothetical protein [Alphaproteobacteria bacterium]MBU2149982.1 hypothetical protein [Alphaproteobacteria bacterium]MBU2306477.1 hypothetical protein [Alphaproteobacteria bacterium]
MTPERFETLAQAWGGDIARWPNAEREAAALLMAARPAWVRDILAGAVDLDDLLDAVPVPTGSPGLTARIVAGAPRPRARRWIGWLMPAGMGVGLAAACAAGVVAGVQLHAPSSTPAASDADALLTAVSDDDVGLYLDEDA